MAGADKCTVGVVGSCGGVTRTLSVGAGGKESQAKPERQAARNTYFSNCIVSPTAIMSLLKLGEIVITLSLLH